MFLTFLLKIDSVFKLIFNFLIILNINIFLIKNMVNIKIKNLFFINKM